MAQYKVAPSAGSAFAGETIKVEADAYVIDSQGLKFFRKSNLVAAFPAYAWMVLVEEETQESAE